jgi:hypothetical protein
MNGLTETLQNFLLVIANITVNDSENCTITHRPVWVNCIPVVHLGRLSIQMALMFDLLLLLLLHHQGPEHMLQMHRSQ